jgi:DNA polymerase-4
MSQNAAPSRRILHCDVDAMFVQCAIAQWPDLRAEDRILVGGSPEGRGVVSSASYGARSMGVHSGMAMATALRICPGAKRVDVPGEMVSRKHAALRTVLERWAPVCAMASVDEAYLDLTGCEDLYGGEPLPATAVRIQQAVLEEAGLHISIGGGTNKLIAKVATSRAKPAGVFVVPAGEEAAFMASRRPADIPGVGPVLVKELERHGVNSIAALRALEVETMKWWWGEERARWMWECVRGISQEPVVVDGPAQSVSAERTFARDLYHDADLERALSALVLEAAQGLRSKGYSARTVTVKLRNTEFKDRQKARTLKEPLRTERAILPVARELLQALRSEQRSAVRLLGVGLSSLTSLDTAEQLSMLELAPPAESERDRKVAALADELRSRFGDRALLPGTVLKPRP